MSEQDIAWCPGCGNYSILASLKQVLSEEGVDPATLVMVSGIGQAAKTPQYMEANFFNGLHGRALPVATAIKAVNRSLTVVAESGDGCVYGEGGNHFIHAIRRNPDITLFVHDNMVYGLTKGQASPTSLPGFTTPIQTADTGGVHNEPFNPIAVSISLGAPFVARAFSGDTERTRTIMKAALAHRGLSIVDILQPCVTFNRWNTHKWYKENTYYVESPMWPESADADTGTDAPHDPTNRDAAMRLALGGLPLALGVIYQNDDRAIFEETLAAYGHDSRPLFERGIDPARAHSLLDSKR